MSAIWPSITTSTTRDVLNKNTGLDLYIHGEQQTVASKRISKATIYNVIVVSNLPIFSATEGNTCQHALEKSHDDMQRLYNKLSKRFSGTLIPEVPKKPISLIDNPTKAKERMKQCEMFLQFCAKTSKIANSEELLQFLSITADKSSQEVVEPVHHDKNDRKVEPKDQRTANKVQLFENAIAVTGEQIFSNVDSDDELPYIGLRPKSKDEKKSNIHKLHMGEDMAGLYQEYSPPVVNMPSAVTQSESRTSTNEGEAASDDDDFESLMRRLDDAKLHREKREEERNEREVNQPRNCASADDLAVPEAGDIRLDDVSKYIDENSDATLAFDLDL